MITNIIINQYSDLSIDSEFNSWKRADSFSCSGLNDQQSFILNEACLLEIQIKVNTIKKPLDYFVSQLDFITTNILKEVGQPSYAIIIDNIPMQKNKLRTYKGILATEIKNISETIQIEEEHEHNYSTIASMIKLNESNLSLILNSYFGDSSTCCLIQTNTDSFFSKETLISFVRNSVTFHRTNTINYCKAIALNQQNPIYIYRYGGDFGKTEISLQVFIKKQCLVEFKKIMHTATAESQNSN